MRSSTKEFHSPQPGHFPSHFGESYPQDEHTYAVFVFDEAIRGCRLGVKNKKFLNHTTNLQIILEKYLYLQSERTKAPRKHHQSVESIKILSLNLNKLSEKT